MPRTMLPDPESLVPEGDPRPQPPEKPLPGECCESGCPICVYDLYAEALAAMERQVITRVLRHTGGNQVRAAQVLGITRGSLRTKIRALGIFIERTVWPDEFGSGDAARR